MTTLRLAAIRILTAGLAAVFLAVPAGAQTESFTLESYIQTALDRSDDVRQARETRLKTAYQRKSQFADAVLPQVSFSLSGPPWGHSANNGYRFNTWDLERQDMSASTKLNLNLFNSFQDYFKVRRTRLTRDAAEQGLETALRKNAYTALETFYDLDLKLSLQEVTGKNLEAQQEQYRLTHDLYESGMKSLSDLLKSETDWRSAELRLATAEAAAKNALMKFNILINREPLAPVTLKAELEAGTTVLPPLAADVARAMEQRPEMRKVKLELEDAETALDQALKGALPTFSIDAALNRSDLGPGRPTNPNPGYQVELSLSLPIGYNGASQYFTYRAAAAERRKSAAAVSGLKKTIRRELHAAYIALERAFKAFDISTKKEKISRQNLDIVNEQYRQGSADVIKLAQAQLDLLSARVERAEALHEAFTNKALYKLAAGDPPW